MISIILAVIVVWMNGRKDDKQNSDWSLGNINYEFFTEYNCEHCT